MIGLCLLLLFSSEGNKEYVNIYRITNISSYNGDTVIHTEAKGLRIKDEMNVVVSKVNDAKRKCKAGVE